jgi:hypothetical protein
MKVTINYSLVGFKTNNIQFTIIGFKATTQYDTLITTLKVSLNPHVHDEYVHTQKIDLYNVDRLEYYVRAAAQQLKCTIDEIKKGIYSLRERLERYRIDELSGMVGKEQKIAITAAEQKEAIDILKADNLLECIEGLLEQAGLITETENGLRLFMILLSRLDKFVSKYPSYSPYNFAHNNPLLFIDIAGDSVWFSSAVTKDISGKTNTVYTIHTTIKILDLSDQPVDMEKLTSDFKTKLTESAFGAYTYDTEGNKTQFVFDVQVSAVKSVDEVLPSDHLLVLVDKTLPSKNANGTPRPSGGWASRGGQVGYVENPGIPGLSGLNVSLIVEGLIHEFGHDLGLPHQVDSDGSVITESKNYMSYGTGTNFFTYDQLNISFDQYIGGGLNQGQSVEVYKGESSNNWMWGTSTNEQPWDFNIKQGDKMPSPVKTPEKVNDNH